MADDQTPKFPPTLVTIKGPHGREEVLSFPAGTTPSRVARRALAAQRRRARR